MGSSVSVLDAKFVQYLHMDISQQIVTYFASAADATARGECVPSTTRGNSVIPHIDSRDYYGKVRHLLESLGRGPNLKKQKQFFYVTGWWIHLSPGPGTAMTIFDPPSLNTNYKRLQPQERLASIMPAFRLEDKTRGPYPLMADLLVQKAAAGVDVRVMGWVNPMLLYPLVTQADEKFHIERWIVATGNIFCIDYLRNRSLGTEMPLAERIAH